MAASDLAVVTDDVTAIKRVSRAQTRRLKSIRAGHRSWSAEDMGQEFIALAHLTGVFANQCVAGQELAALDTDGVGILNRIVFAGLVANAPRLRETFQI